MQSFTTDDAQTIHVTVSGDGPPVVLLHEWASNFRVWTPLMKDLETTFTVYRWDARGHGGHPVDGAEPASVGRMAEDLRQMLDHFGLERPAVVAHSMGALTAWEYIDRYGCDRLSKLGVIDQSPRLLTDDDWRFGIYYDWPPERNQTFVADLKNDFVETVMKLVALGKNKQARARYEDSNDGLWRLRAFLATADPPPLIDIWESLAEADYRPVLKRITIPTLLVYGSDSNYYGAETGEYVQSQIPGANLIVYLGADHSPHVGDPHRFTTDLMGFLQRG
ncbi:MAG: alpha/beta hydrolase [Rhodospirillales bacterium]|nr:alpha/beta hydrolase [Rhodospirillales bacterium]